jgi:hypothetical protein
MKKTQPLSTMPEPMAPISPITTVPAVPVARAPEPAVEHEIPMALCWGLLAISVIVLLVQIWNYFG